MSLKSEEGEMGYSLDKGPWEVQPPLGILPGASPAGPARQGLRSSKAGEEKMPHVGGRASARQPPSLTVYLDYGRLTRIPDAPQAFCLPPYPRLSSYRPQGFPCCPRH